MVGDGVAALAVDGEAGAVDAPPGGRLHLAGVAGRWRGRVGGRTVHDGQLAAFHDAVTEYIDYSNAISHPETVTRVTKTTTTVLNCARKPLSVHKISP